MLQQNLYGISLGQLEIFFAAAEHSSFTKAAVSLNMTQSAVSKAVAKLEQALDILLFQRRYREIVLTEAGRALYDRWKQSVTEISRSYADVRQVLLSKTRCLRIGATNTTDLTLYFWPLVNRFMQSHSEIRLEFDSDSINRLVEKLMDRRLDLIFIPDFMHYTVEKVGMNWCWAAQDNAQVVLPKEHPLAHETLTLDTIKNEKIAVLDEHTPDNERWLRELFQSKGYQMNIGRVFNSPESIAHFYQHPDGIMLSDRYFDYGPNTEVLVKKPLHGVKNGIICAWRPDHCTEEVRQFLRIIHAP